MFSCSCCGTEVTSPYFYNGDVYGWTCIKKANPNEKRNKPKSKCVEVDVLKIKTFPKNSCRSVATILVNGKKELVAAYREHLGEGVFSEFIEIGNFKFHNGKWWAFINS